MLTLLHNLRRVRLQPVPSGTGLRPRPDERMKIFPHGNVSNDSENRFLWQVAEGRDPLLPKVLRIKQARAFASREIAGQIMQMIEAVITFSFDTP